MVDRRKVGAAHSDFTKEIDRLLRLDAQNQQRFRVGPGRPGPTKFSKGQMTLITEGIFMRAFSLYEAYLEDVFILYSRGKRTRTGHRVKSFLKPSTGSHARDMIKSQMTFLEWNSPDNVIKRCDIYLGDGNPIKRSITTNITRLKNMRKIRNAIAHKSIEARANYASVVRGELRASPLIMPEPGEFLITTDPRDPDSYFLVIYLDVLKTVADISAG